MKRGSVEIAGGISAGESEIEAPDSVDRTGGEAWEHLGGSSAGGSEIEAPDHVDGR